MQATLDALPEVLFRADWYLHADVADEFHDDFSESTLLGSLGLACYENEASSSARCDMRATTRMYINSIVKKKGSRNTPLRLCGDWLGDSAPLPQAAARTPQRLCRD